VPQARRVFDSGDSRMKKVGGHSGAKEKVRRANINVYLAQ